MSKKEQFIPEKNNEQFLYEERAQFIKENYPRSKSHYEISELLSSGLDGMEAIEKRSKNGEIEGLISYTIDQDREETLYLSIGIMLTGKQFEGEGIMSELFSKVKEIAENNACEYITVIADTEEGENFLSNKGFNEEGDHFRLDLF